MPTPQQIQFLWCKLGNCAGISVFLHQFLKLQIRFNKLARTERNLQTGLRSCVSATLIYIRECNSSTQIYFIGKEKYT